MGLKLRTHESLLYTVCHPLSPSVALTNCQGDKG